MNAKEIACRTCLAQAGEDCDPKLSVVNAEGVHNERFWDAMACTTDSESQVPDEMLHRVLVNSNRF